MLKNNHMMGVKYIIMMRKIDVVLCYLVLEFFFSMSVCAQLPISIDGGKSAKSVSTYTKIVDGERVVSARMIFQSSLSLEFSTNGIKHPAEDTYHEVMMNGLNKYSIIFYLNKGANINSIDVTSEGYDTYSISDIEFQPKESYDYYVFDPNVEKQITRIIKNREEVQYLKQGRDLFKANKIDEALVAFDRAISCNLLCDSAYYEKGKIYLSLKNYVESYNNYRMALNINREFVEACDDIIDNDIYILATEKAGSSKFHFFAYLDILSALSAEIDYGVFIGAMSNTPTLINHCKEALSKNPENLQAMYMLMYAYNSRSDYDNMIDMLKRYVAISSKGGDLVCNIVRSMFSSTSSTGLYNVDREFNIPPSYMMEYVNTIKYIFKEAANKYPQDYRYNAFLADCYVYERRAWSYYARKGRMTSIDDTESFKISLGLYQKLLNIANLNNSAEQKLFCVEQLAFTYEILGDTIAANEYKLKIPELKAQDEVEKNTPSLDPISAQEYYELGLDAIKRRDYVSTWKYFHKALLKDPEIDDIYDRIRSLDLIQRAVNSMVRLYSYSEFKKIDPTLANNYVLLGSLTDSYSQAILYYKKAIENENKCSAAHYMLGYTYSKQKKYDDAKTSYKLALSGDGDAKLKEYARAALKKIK